MKNVIVRFDFDISLGSLVLMLGQINNEYFYVLLCVNLKRGIIVPFGLGSHNVILSGKRGFSIVNVKRARLQRYYCAISFHL